MNKSKTRIDLAQNAIRDLLEDLETRTSPISHVLMRAKRIARLLRDEDAQRWLELETSGYPAGLDFGQLGSCKKYVIEGGRYDTTSNRYHTKSLFEVEAEHRAAEIALNTSIPPAGMMPVFDNFLQADATLRVAKVNREQLEALIKKYCRSSVMYAAMRAAVHSYAADCSLALELGDVAEEIFESARNEVDRFVRSHCPAAVQQIVAISERMQEQDAPESLSSALNLCRRLLSTVADSVFPARSEPYTGKSGKERKVGQEEYKNRLLAYLEVRLDSKGSYSVHSSELKHLAARLDSVYEKTCKGVHADVSVSEARLAVIHTYLFLAEVARVTSGSEA